MGHQAIAGHAHCKVLGTLEWDTKQYLFLHTEKYWVHEAIAVPAQWKTLEIKIRCLFDQYQIFEALFIKFLHFFLLTCFGICLKRF